MSEVTQLLEAADRGERDAGDKLLQLVYSELHRMAEQKLAGELPGQTLQPTALVHDAWLQLVGEDGESGLANRASLLSVAAAQAMRRILIDRARRRCAEKTRWRRGAR
jgi:RNA polymerase sigma factor (TIGR02999 family)